jgi:hypothetical protein
LRTPRSIARLASLLGLLAIPACNPHVVVDERGTIVIKDPHLTGACGIGPSGVWIAPQLLDGLHCITPDTDPRILEDLARTAGTDMLTRLMGVKCAPACGETPEQKAARERQLDEACGASRGSGSPATATVVGASEVGDGTSSPSTDGAASLAPRRAADVAEADLGAPSLLCAAADRDADMVAICKRLYDASCSSPGTGPYECRTKFNAVKSSTAEVSSADTGEALPTGAAEEATGAAE